MLSIKKDRRPTVRARDLASSTVVTVPMTLSLKDLAIILHENEISGVPVVDDEGRLAGVVTKSDMVRYSATRLTPRSQWPDFVRELFEEESELLSETICQEDNPDARVVDVYTPNVIVAHPEDDIHKLARLMREHRVHRLILVSEGKPVGVVSAMDLLQAIAGGVGSPCSITRKPRNVQPELAGT